MTKKTKIIIITVACLFAIGITAALICLQSGNRRIDDDTTSSAPYVISSVTESDPYENAEETVSKQEVAADKTAVGIEDTTAQRGKTIRIPVSISNNPGIAASALKIEYNGHKLTYIGYDEGEVFENYFFKEENNALLFSNIENGDTKKNGVMFYLKFKVKDDAAVGDTEIKVNVTNESFINFDEEFVTVGAGNAIVTIR